MISLASVTAKTSHITRVDKKTRHAKAVKRCSAKEQECYPAKIVITVTNISNENARCPS
jgi:hypothetical protein